MTKRITIAVLAVCGCVTFYLNWNRDQSSAARFNRAAADSGSVPQIELRPSGNSMRVNYSSQVAEALTLVDPVQRSIEFCSRLKEWLDSDFEAALDYLRHCPRGNEYTGGIRIVLARVQDNDPARAVVLAGDMVTVHDEMHVYNELFSRMVTNNPSDATRLLAEVPRGEGYTNSLRAIASTWPDTDTELAFNWALNLPSADRDIALQSLFMRYAETEPRAAIENSKQFLGNDLLQPIIERASLKWFEQDPEAALESIKKLPTSLMTAPIVTEIIKALAGKSPEAAVDWIDSIRNPEMAGLARRTFVTILSRNDPEPAKQYLGKSN